MSDTFANAIAKIQSLFKESLCLQDSVLEADGYLSVCAINTYLLALPIVVLLLYSTTKLRGLHDNFPKHSRTGHAKMVLVVISTILTTKFGPQFYNVISLTVSLLAQMYIFVLTFMEFNGVNVPRQFIELYYHIWAAATLYYLLKLVTDEVELLHDSRVIALGLVCLSSFVSGFFRNVVDAIEPEIVVKKQNPSTK